MKWHTEFLFSNHFSVTTTYRYTCGAVIDGICYSILNEQFRYIDTNFHKVTFISCGDSSRATSGKLRKARQKPLDASFDFTSNCEAVTLITRSRPHAELFVAPCILNELINSIARGTPGKNEVCSELHGSFESGL